MSDQIADLVVTRELLETWIKQAENGDVYAVTSEGRLLRLCGALLAGEVHIDGQVSPNDPHIMPGGQS